MPDVKMLAELAGPQPHEGGGDFLEKHSGHEAALFGRKPPSVSASDNEMEEVVFPFKLIAIRAKNASECVGHEAEWIACTKTAGKEDSDFRLDSRADRCHHVRGSR